MSTLFLLAQTPTTTQSTVVIEPIAPVAEGQPGGNGSSTSTISSGTAAPAATQAESKSPFDKSLFLMIGMLFVVMYLFSRSKKKAERQKQESLSTLKRGDRVQTIGGIMGTVVEATAEKVLLKVDETSNTKISFARSAVHRVISSEGKGD